MICLRMGERGGEDEHNRTCVFQRVAMCLPESVQITSTFSEVYVKISGHPLLAPTPSLGSSQRHPGAMTLWESEGGQLGEKKGRVWESVCHLFGKDGLGYVFHKCRELSEELGEGLL